MPKRALRSLGPLVKAKRGTKKLRETARAIGIGPATLLRVESGRTPDILTFGKVCAWLEINPGDFLGYPTVNASESPDTTVALSAHLKAERTADQKTVQALAKMIAIAAQLQPQPSTDKDAQL